MTLYPGPLAGFLTIAAAAPLAMGQPSLAADDMAHGADGMVMVPNAGAVKWAPAPPSLPKGMDLVVVSGDPAKPGPFTLRVRMPANTVIAPHTHATDENLTVLSGRIVHNVGKTIDKPRGHVMDAQGFVYLPADVPHSLWTDSEPAVLQVTGTGPFGLTYVDPADDPSRKASAE